MTKQENLQLEPVQKEMADILLRAARRADDLAEKIHDSATGGNLDYERMDAEARQDAMAIKGALGVVHVLNVGQRIIENAKQKQLNK